MLYLAAMLVPAGFALGNSLFSPIMSALFTGFVWNKVMWHAPEYFKEMEIGTEKPTNMFVAWLVLNFAVLWILARFAVLTGFGAMNYMYVAGLAVVGNFVQYGVWQAVEKKK